ncbi:lipase [Amycolatopsis sp. 195334CR]|nr:lipase [Amycolatopsis sp. 195334CR]
MLRAGACALTALLALSVTSTVSSAVEPAAPEAAAAGLPGPFDDSFYTPPSTLPAGKPGDVIRWRPSIPGLNTLNANAWEVMYLSVNALGKPNAVTGTVLVPKGVDPAKAPIVGFGVGTQGPAFKCTPSKAISRGTLYDQPAINDSLSAGYAVAVTDYEGYSKDTVPTYIVGQSMGPALIDSVRAAQNLDAAKLSKTSKVVFQGYSQGGGAAMWAAEKQPSYAPELNLVGVAAGGVPADLNEVAKGLDGYLGFGFLAFAAVGLDTAYADLKLDSYLNDTGRTELQEAKENACVVELLANYPFKKISDYTTSNPLNTPQWQARLAQNKLGANPPKVPVFQYHAVADEIVNTPQADALHKTYCGKGVKVQWNTYLAEHLTGIFAGNGDAHQWITDRFAGASAPSNC